MHGITSPIQLHIDEVDDLVSGIWVPRRRLVSRARVCRTDMLLSAPVQTSACVCLKILAGVCPDAGSSCKLLGDVDRSAYVFWQLVGDNLTVCLCHTIMGI